MKASGDFRTS